MFKNGMRPVHPGEILLEDYIKPLGISVRALSLALHVPYSRLREVVDGNRGVSADTALRLERYFGSEAQGWLNLQTAYDLRVAEKLNAKTIHKEIAPLTMAACRTHSSKSTCQIQFHAIGGPGRYSGAKEVGIFCPYRTGYRHGTGEHRPVISIAHERQRMRHRVRRTAPCPHWQL